MTKLLLLAALGVASLVSAKTIISQPEKVEVSKIQGVQDFRSLKQEIRIKAQSTFTGNHQWIAIDSGCGQQYFLDLNDYSDDLAGLVALRNDIAFFSDQKCKGAAATNQLTQFT